MFTIGEILPLVGEHEFEGDARQMLDTVLPLSDVATAADLSHAVVWVGDAYVARFPERLATRIGLLLLTPAAYEKLKDRPANFLLVAEPRRAFATLLEEKFRKEIVPRIDPSAAIEPTATLGRDCHVGRNVVIEAGVRIGDRCVVLHNSVVREGTVIGDRVRIGCNCTIGSPGFGYAKDERGDWRLIEHLGRVRIEDDVHVHDNVCIDRAVLGETVIGRNVKIDNLVHVAHGVRIGENSLVIANSMVGGSVEIGRDCWIAPSTTIKNKVRIADRTLAGLGCVILKDTDTGAVMIGNPAIRMEEYKRWSKLREQLYLNFDTDLR
jgi:UDP-3-O-[3-hydroxymyristoyl] glucosamine N-acyltransferase LpxD